MVLMPIVIHVLTDHSWFAYISPTEPCLLEDVLIRPKHSLCKQVHDHYLPKLLPHGHDADSENDMKARNILFNIDGAGMAWYTPTRFNFESGEGAEDLDASKQEIRPALFRTVLPPLNDLNFRSICANTETKVCFGHVRAASGAPITPVNNHPFVFGRHTFMHNGVISSFSEIRRALCAELSQAAFANVFGATDSEHIAALYMTNLTGGGDISSFEREYPVEEMAEAMHKAVATVLALQQKFFGHKKQPNSLNLCATDGTKLVAYRFRNHRVSQPPSLYYSTQAGKTLNRKYPDHPDGVNNPEDDGGIPAGKHGKHLIIASEPTTYKESDWELIGRNQYVVADADGTFEIRDAPYGSDWDAAITSLSRA